MKRVGIVALAALLAGFAQPSMAEDKLVTIGTGSVTGVYYPAGGAICRLVNRGRKDHGIRCFVESTGGSIANLRGLQEGELNFGIAQTDWIDSAYNGLDVFSGSAMTDLRSLFSLHSEMFTIAVGKDSGIHDLDGLKGKRVNVGDQGSGMRETMQALMAANGWSKANFASFSELNPTLATKALCEGKIDAMVFSAGHPNGLIQDITSNCDAVLIPVEGKSVDKLLAEHTYYSRTAIPGGMYQGNAHNVPTFGVKATLVTTSGMDEDAVYQLTKSVFENFDSFKTLHFVFATLDKERMVNTGIIAPFHPGALRYFKEAGLLKNPAAAATTAQ